MRLVITRPEGDAQSMSAAMRDVGIDTLIAPLIDIRQRRNVVVPAMDYQAIIATSANGVRGLKLHGTFAQFAKLPIYTVGDASAMEAKCAGFADIHSAQGDLGDLAALIERQLKTDRGSLLYASGARISGDLAGALTAKGFEVDRVIFYDAVAIDALDKNIIAGAESGTIDGVVLMSPRTAKIWAALAAEAHCEALLAKLTYYCLSPAVGIALRDGLQVVESNITTAPKPNAGALIETILASRPRN